MAERSFTELIEVFDTPEHVARAAAVGIVELAHHAILERGRFNLFLSGGSTPKRLHALLAREFKDQIDWSKVWLFCGDERYLPEGDANRNETMFRETLLEPLAFDEARFFPMPVLGSAAKAAYAYEQTLRENLVGPADLMLLGMGPDGHCLSLFPNSPALGAEGWVTSGPGLNPPAAERVTVTLSFLSQVSQGWFLVTGGDKQEKLHAIEHGGNYPAGVVTRRLGACRWMVDSAAAN